MNPRRDTKLTDQFHCPNCRGRLAAVSTDALRCGDCERVIPITDGIADFVGDSLPLGAATDRYRGHPPGHRPARMDLFTRIQAAASDRWPVSLGDALEFGCGRGETTHAILATQKFRGLLVLDTEMEMLQACRTRIAENGFGADRPVAYATLSGAQDVLRDAVVDTVIGTGLLPGIGDVRAFLATIHRVLKPNGRAVFVVPNRRYHEAMCLAMAEALVQRYARDGIWSEGQHVALELLAETRRLLVHRGNPGFLAGLDMKHLFDSDALEDLGREVGFSVAEMIPLDPDPAGAETTQRFCQDAGAPDSFTETFGALAAAVGQPFFNLLNRQDSSASMLLWLTKASGPGVRIYTHRPPPPVGQVGPDAALGGAAPRWSVELLAHDTADGIVVAVGGWCLCNTDVLWVRLTLDDVIQYAPVWRPRPDVHEVLNRTGIYHPLNTLCSGMASEVLFEGVHPAGNTHPFRLDIVLASGLIMTGPAPEMLLMDEPMVIAH
ncbi:MAG: methyltransferase protein [Rhodopila sp.]|nr:methyltransferase protein [Rhodopila sp.]